MMEELLHGNILLVGEGDFSFAVSMVEKVPSNKCRSLLATSLETEESIKKHQYADKNISQLLEKDVTVRLETDATLLHVTPFISAERFDCIIFNFPHAGGKSNHKKNRKLLNDFFASAVQVLKKQGQIIVTLCKGQGGTPADQPMRAWHDSWQIVSMAANSDLILTKVLPFKAEDYSVYTSTGFRSLDKGFHTENALSHVFEIAEPVHIPASTERVKVKVGTHILLCPPYIYRKLKQIRFIKSIKNHPVHRVFDRIIQQLKATVSSFTVESRGIHGPINTTDKSKNLHEGTVASDNFCFHTQSENIEHIDFDQVDDMSELASEKMLNKGPDQNEAVIFVSDPLNLFDREIFENIQAVCVPVYQPCLISINKSALSYHIAVAWPVVTDQRSVIDSNSTHESFSEAVYAAIEKFKDILNKVISKPNYRTEIVVLKNSSSLLVDTERSSHTADIVVCYQSCARNGADSDRKESIKIGSCHVNVTGDCVCPSTHLYLTADVCKLACLRYNIEDERLLWSNYSRVLDQFVELENEDQRTDSNTLKSESVENCVRKTDQTLQKSSVQLCVAADQVSVFKRPSLFPLTFVHDMSFWENPIVPFNVIEYCTIIRDVAGDSVINVELIDTYHDTVSGRSSRCYRLTFQSADEALSYNTSWKLQSMIRLEVEKTMKIILR